MLEFTAKDIANLIGGKVEGDPEIRVNTLAKIEEGKPGALCFLSNPAYAQYIYSTKASLVIVNDDFVPEHKLSVCLIRVPNAYHAFSKLLEVYNQIKNNKIGIEQPSFISASAKIGKDVYIGAFAYIGDNVEIGDNAKIFPQTFIGDNVKIGNTSTLFSGVKIYSDCFVGNNVTLHSGVIVGGDGFGFAPNSQGNYNKVPQIGNVVIEDYVEVGAGTTIDRATLGSTIIRKGVKLDNLIQIAHNVEIGENTVIAAQSGVAGSTKIGSNCMIGGQVGIVGHLTIANGVKIAAQSGIGNSITKEGEIMQGSPAFSIGGYKRSYILFRKFPEINQKISELEKLIAEQITKE